MPPSPLRRTTPIRCRTAALAAVLAAAGTGARAQAGAPADDAPAQVLARVEVTGRHDDNGVGSSDAASAGTIGAARIARRPSLRPGDLLELVPGLAVTQHSGGGKANQYFLRGFSLDHGTDFATSVDGVPVNMPTHGHGQGYSDLNFLIPELVDGIAYRKGPYFATSGDFSAAGSADIAYRRAFDAPFAAATLGERGYRRLVAGASVAAGAGSTLLGALELQRNDGPWTVPERLRRANGVLAWSGGSRARGWSASLMGYGAHWTATDQVPQRLVDAGAFGGRPFGRFDSLDPSDGGRSRRTSVSGEWHRRTDRDATRLAACAIDSRLELFSNFTYALERPADGDQFAQRDRRTVRGLAASHAFDHALGTLPARTELGLQLRHDRIRVGLFDTVARRVTGVTRDDRVRETRLGLYGETSVELAPWLRGSAGLRADGVHFDVAALQGGGSPRPSPSPDGGRAHAQRLSPKLSLVFGPWADTELFVNAGRGFHSNDARGATARVDPRSGEPVGTVPALVAARGVEIGARTEWVPRLQSSLALWALDVDSELVYVGDAGTTQPRRPAARRGIEWSNRWTPARWLRVDADWAWTRARFTGADPAGDRIPNSVDSVASVAVTAHDAGPWSAGVQWRRLGAGALVEDGSVRSRPSATTNLRIGRRLARHAALTLDVFNAFDRKANDIEYVYASRLPGERAPVDDRHVHPAEPRTLRLTLEVGF